MVCVTSNKNATLKLNEEEGTTFGSGNESGDTVPAATEAVANDKRFYKRDETTTKIINFIICKRKTIEFSHSEDNGEKRSR